MANNGKRRGRGEGSIEQLPDGKFRAFLSAGFVSGKDGKPKRRRISRTFDTKREALIFLRTLQAAQANGQFVIAEPSTVADWLDRWLALYKPQVAASTYDHDAWRVEHHLKPRIGAVPLGKLSALNVEEMLARMAESGESTSERHKAGGILRKALGAAVRLRLLASNVAKDVKLPRVVRPEKTALDAAQAIALLTATRPIRLAAFFDLALDTGMRPGELFGLHWPDVNFDEGWVFVHQTMNERGGRPTLKEPKTKASRRRIRIAPRTVAALRRHRDAMAAEKHDVERGLVFCNLHGNPLRRNNFISKLFKPLLKRAGLPAIRPYNLRHTSATLLLAAGVNIRVISERLGHESVEITLKHYVHVLPCMQEKAAEAVECMFGAIGTTMAQSGVEGDYAI